ncbi:MAG: glycosyltransferase family 92 protein [Planctomycetaceae bacterium]|jgi:hypothetical protein|nr:glycosyltransferase family 92 protein [Planctomycetaceae bacterium]
MAKICAVALFKSCQRQLLEWIDYHTLVGIEHFYLCQDVSSNIEMRMSQRLLAPYIEEHRVTLYDARELFSSTVGQSYATRRRPFYDIVLHQLQTLQELNPYEWMTCLDIEDFLVPKVHGTLPLLLEQFDPDNITGVMFNGMAFGYGNSDDIPVFTPDSIIDSCRSYLINENCIKSIGSIKHSTYWHAHHPVGNKPLVNPEGKATDFVNPVASYTLAFFAHYLQPSLEVLNLKWQNANYPYPDGREHQESRRNIVMNRFLNNEWVNYPKKNKFDPNVTSSAVVDLYELRKQGLLPEPPVPEPTPEPAPEVETTQETTPEQTQTTDDYVDSQQPETEEASEEVNNA